MAEAPASESTQNTAATAPDIHLVPNDSAPADKPMGVVVPAPDTTKPINPAPEAFTDTGYSNNIINTPEVKVEPKPVGSEAMPQAKAPDGQRSVLDSTVNPTSIAPDGRSEEDIAAAKAALDKHVAETNAVSPKPFSEHGYPDSVLNDNKATTPTPPESVTSTPEQTITTPDLASPPATPTTEAKPPQKTFLQKLQFWKN